MAAQFAGPLLPVLRSLPIIKQEGQTPIRRNRRCGTANGAGDTLYEAYLTFVGILKIAASTEDATEIRVQ
jgi:hypothetical protein